MGFLSRIFYNTINWRSKKVFFDGVSDTCLTRLLVFKGAKIVYSKKIADITIVNHHVSCWWARKEISLYDLYYILSDADKYLYYLWRLKYQHHPEPSHEKVFIIHNYMVLVDFYKKTFSIYHKQHVPFIDQKLYTKKVLQKYNYLRIWIGDYTTNTQTTSADSLLVQLSGDMCMSIRDAVCVFQNDKAAEPFFIFTKPSWTHIFNKKTMSCKIIHQS